MSILTHPNIIEVRSIQNSTQKQELAIAVVPYGLHVGYMVPA